MEHAKINGVELAHEVVGSGEAVLLMHGSHIADALQPLVAEPALEGDHNWREAIDQTVPGGSRRP